MREQCRIILSYIAGVPTRKFYTGYAVDQPWHLFVFRSRIVLSSLEGVYIPASARLLNLNMNSTVRVTKDFCIIDFTDRPFSAHSEE